MGEAVDYLEESYYGSDVFYGDPDEDEPTALSETEVLALKPIPQVVVMRKLRAMLDTRGVKTQVISSAKTGSTYLRFLTSDGREDTRMGKIRIGDHAERQRYCFRWQIRLDIPESYTDMQKNNPRFFYSPKRLMGAVNHMLQYKAAIQRGERYEKKSGY